MSLDMDLDLVDLELKGTTVMASYYEEGIMLGMESRSSNEGQRIFKLKIDDDVDKLIELSPSIISAMLGKRKHLMTLKRHLEKECLNTDSVSLVYKTTEKYMNDSLKEDPKAQFGTIICGRDADKGLQINSVYVDSGLVVGKTDHRFVIFGSGHKHARKIVDKMMGTTDESMYNYDLSAEASLDMFLKSLFSATFTDRLSGGPLHVYRLRLHDQSWEPICHRDVLKAYADYYDDYDEEKTLFLIFNSAKGFDPVYSDDLKSFFRAYGEIDIAHRVADIPIAKNTGFYFHRLVCKTAEDATRIHDHVKKGGGPHGLDLSKVPVLLREFPDGVFFHTMQPTLRLYVNRCSKRLLQVIRDSVSTK